MNFIIELVLSFVLILIPFFGLSVIHLRVFQNKLTSIQILAYLTFAPHFLGLLFYYGIMISPRGNKFMTLGAILLLQLLIITFTGQTKNLICDLKDSFQEALNRIHLLIKHSSLFQFPKRKTIFASLLIISFISLWLLGGNVNGTNVLFLTISTILLSRVIALKRELIALYALAILPVVLIALRMKEFIFVYLILLMYLEVDKSRIKFSYRIISLLILSPFIIIILYAVKYLKFINSNIVWGSSDVFEYASFGKFILKANYDSIFAKNFVSESIFMKNFFHSPGYALQFSLNQIQNDLFELSNYTYVKILCFSQALLIFILFTNFCWKNKRLFILVSWTLILTPVYFSSFNNLEIESFRLAPMSAVLILMATDSDKFNSEKLWLITIGTGIAAFAHSLNCLLLSLIPAWLIFQTLQKKVPCKSCAAFLSCMILTGYFHYIYDLIWGSGWLKNLF